MLNSLEDARQLSRERSAKAAAAKVAALASARKMAIAVATNTKPPTADEIIGLVDSLNVGVEWFESAVKNCLAKIAEHEGLARIPELEKQCVALEAEAIRLTELAGDADAKRKVAIEAVKNQDGGRSFEFFGDHVTPEMLAAKRKTANDHIELCDQIFLAKRDVRLLRKQIAELSRVDRDNVDHECGEQAPNDFKLPPLQ